MKKLSFQKLFLTLDNIERDELCKLLRKEPCPCAFREKQKKEDIKKHKKCN